jgi:hypothetical protein
LQQAIDSLEANPHKDEWMVTPGNAVYTTAMLLSWAKEHPEAEWSGD